MFNSLNNTPVLLGLISSSANRQGWKQNMQKKKEKQTNPTKEK